MFSTSWVGGVTPSAPNPPRISSKSRKSFCCGAKQNELPVHPPCPLRPPAQDGRCVPRLCHRQLGQEGSCFSRPPSADITSQHNQTCASASPTSSGHVQYFRGVLRPTAPSLFPAPSCDPSQCKLDPRWCPANCRSPNREPVRDHFQTFHVKMIGACNFHAQCSLCHALRPLDTHGFPELQTWRNTRIEWSATPTITLVKERETQATQQSARER